MYVLMLYITFKMPDCVDELYNLRPDLFLYGHLDSGDYGVAPIVHLVQTNNLEGVYFYFDNEIPFENVKAGTFFGGLNRKSLLDFAVSKEMVDFLTSKGFADPKISGIHTVDFGFNYDSFQTGKKLNLKTDAENPWYEKFRTQASNYINSNGGYENLFLSNPILIQTAKL